MDLGIIQGILGFTVIVVLIGSVLYYISVSSMKEKTYDEVKAEQKKKAEEYLAQGRTAKEKAKDKKLKKAGKKVKEKKSSDSVELSSEEGDNNKSHVSFIEPPVVVDDEPVVREEIEVKSVEPQKQSSAKQQHKAVSTNPPKEVKVEKQQAQKQTQPPQKPAEKPTNSSKSSEKPTVKSQEKAHDKPKPAEEIIVKNVTKQNQSIPLPATVSEHASPSTKNSRKKRSEFATLQQFSDNKEAVNVNLLMPLVHKAELSRTDLQVLIDLLLNKQQGLSGDSAEWIEGRQDPVVKLRKQLAEKEKALIDEQQASVALQSKLRELRGELNAERHSTRQLEENLSSRQTELNSLGVRLQHSADEKQNLLKQIQQLQAQLSEEHMLLCKVQEDQSQAQNVMQQELLAQRQQLEMHIARLTEQHQETIAALEGQLSQMSVQLQQQEEIRERAHLHDSHDLTRQLKELHSEVDRLRSKSQFDTNHLQNEISSLTEQLTLKRAETDKLNALVQSLQTENKRLTHQISSACVEAQQLRDENESLAAQVTASMERPATEGRENGDLTYPESKPTDTESDKLQEKELQLEKLKDDIVSKEKEINRFKTEYTQQESLIKSLKNDLDVAFSNSEKMLKEISTYKSLIQEHEGVIKALRDDGESAHKLVNALREDIAKNKVEMVRLSQDCATREQLESRESTIEKLTSELNTHKTELADQTAIIKNLQAEVEKYKVQASNQQLLDSSEVKRLRTTITDRETELRNLKTQAEQMRAELAIIMKTAAQLSAERDSIKSQLDTQLAKNDEAEERVKVQEQERTKQLLQRLLPNVTVESKQDYEQWLEQFTTCARSNSSADNNEAAMLAEVEQQNCQLQAMVTHYKTIIADTEGMLNRLQSHVEQEEDRWGQQIQTLKSQLQAVTLERDRLEAGGKNGISTVDAGSDTN